MWDGALDNALPRQHGYIGPTLVSHWRYWRWCSLVKPYWLNIACVLVILALAMTCREILDQYWLAIGTCDIGFISAPNNGIIPVQHIGNRPVTNIMPIVRLMLAQNWLKTKYLLKNSSVKKQQNDIQVH